MEQTKKKMDAHCRWEFEYWTLHIVILDIHSALLNVRLGKTYPRSSTYIYAENSAILKDHWRGEVFDKVTTKVEGKYNNVVHVQENDLNKKLWLQKKKERFLMKNQNVVFKLSQIKDFPE